MNSSIIQMLHFTPKFALFTPKFSPKITYHHEYECSMQGSLKVNVYAKSTWEKIAADVKTPNIPFLIQIWLAYPIITTKQKIKSWKIKASITVSISVELEFH